MDNESDAATARALNLRVEAGREPMRLNYDRRVTNLNADKLDGREAAAVAEPWGYAHFKLAGEVDPAYPSKGVNGILTPTSKPNVYCFGLTFTLKEAVGAHHPNNAAVGAMGTQTNAFSESDIVDNECNAPHDDAVARTYGSNGANAAINFQIVFE